MQDLLPELIRLWGVCRPLYEKRPLTTQVSEFAKWQAAPLFIASKLGGAQLGFIEDMVWEAVRKGGTHSNDEISAARGTANGIAIKS